MTGLMTQPGLLERDDLVESLDRALSRRVTVISAPPGSGKTSLLRAWVKRSAGLRRVAFVSVDGEQLVEQVLSELDEHVVVIDDLHELKSVDALAQLELVLARMPSTARVV